MHAGLRAQAGACCAQPCVRPSKFIRRLSCDTPVQRARSGDGNARRAITFLVAARPHGAPLFPLHLRASRTGHGTCARGSASAVNTRPTSSRYDTLRSARWRARVILRALPHAWHAPPPSICSRRMQAPGYVLYGAEWRRARVPGHRAPPPNQRAAACAV